MKQNEKDTLFVEERRKGIIEYLQVNQKANVAELAKKFQVAGATIRRDLGELELRGLLQRTHGGALSNLHASEESTLRERQIQNREAKEQIAYFVSKLIRNGETLFIDGGSTTLELAKMLKSKSNLVILTNAPDIANELVDCSSFQVMLTGGVMVEKTRVLVGSIAEHTIKQFRADRVILGMSTLLPEEGFFTVNYQEAELKRTMLKCGKEKIIALDSSKVGKTAFSFVADFMLVDKLITDSGIVPKDVELLEKNDIEVIVV